MYPSGIRLTKSFFRAPGLWIKYFERLFFVQQFFFELLKVYCLSDDEVQILNCLTIKIKKKKTQ